MSATNLKPSLIAYARSLGFERVGITSAEPLRREGEFLKRWLAEGRAGEMSYLERAQSDGPGPSNFCPEPRA